MKKKNSLRKVRSDIPYAQRLQMQHRGDIMANREEAAKTAMYCNSLAMHELYGIGYKRLVKFSSHFKAVVDEFYRDEAVGMAHAKRRMEQMGRPISGEYYRIPIPGLSKKGQQIQDNRLQATQVALICSAIAMNDVFGFGQKRQEMIARRSEELTGEYARKGRKWLLEEMEKLGFVIQDGEVIGFTDEEGEPISPGKWERGKKGCVE